MLEGVKVALDPSPAQEKLLASHAGGARFAYNAMLARVKAALDAGESIDQSFYALRKQWNMDKDALAVGEDGKPWWSENSKGSLQLRVGIFGEGGLSNWSKSRKGDRKGRKVGPQSSRPRTRRRPGSRTRLAGLV